MMRREVTLSMILAATLAPAAARADEPKLLPYTVQKGDACDIVALKVLGDARLTDVVHKYNPQLGPRPHHLVPGQVLMLPPPSPDARLEWLRNHVEVETRPGQPNDPLWRGNRVSTGDQSAAEMKFRDETQLSMGEQTLVIVLGTTRTSVAQPADATLVNGSLRGRLAELAGKKSIATASAQVNLGAGEAQVTVDAKKATRLAVYEGRSTVVALETTVKVDGGFGSKTLLGHPPAPPRPLPPAPTWSTSPAAFTITSQPTIDVAGEYARGTGGPDTAVWHVELARDAQFHDLLVDTKVPVDITRLEAKQLVSGAYYTRVSAIDADVFEGPWSATKTIRVAQVKEVDLPNHYGSIEPSDPKRSDVVCGLDDGPRGKGVVRVDRTSAHVVKCSLAADGSDGSDPGAVGAMAFPAEDIVPLALHGRWLQTDLASRQGEAVLDLTDAHAKPLSRAGARIVATTPGVELAVTEAGYAPGRYFVKTRWSPGVSSVRYRLTLGDVAADSNDVAIEAPQAKGAKEPPSPIEASLGGGIGVVGAGLAQPGARFEATFGGRFRAGPGMFLVGGAFTIERYVAISASSADVGQSPGASFSVSHTDVGLGVPIGYRLGSGHGFEPYVVALPQAFFQTSSFDSAGTSQSGSARFFTLTGTLGAQVHAGPGAIFLEASYRGAWTLDHSFGSVTLQGALGTLGYRFEL